MDDAGLRRPDRRLLLALSQFVMVLVLGLMYLKRADRDYDPLAQKVVDLAGKDHAR